MDAMSNAEKFEWCNPGDHGQKREIKIDELLVDYTYQRAEGCERHLRPIAREFSWTAFGVVIVMERENGKKYIVDGQQRVAAARSRGDIESVPCLVFKSTGRDHEAMAFYSLNARRRTVSARAKFLARATAGAEPESKIMEYLKSIGYRVHGGSHGDKFGLQFVSAVVRCWNGSEKHCKLAIETQREIVGDQPMHGLIHKGLYCMSIRGVEIKDHIQKLVRSGGKDGILMSIKQVSIVENYALPSEMVCARGILKIINSGKRNGGNNFVKLSKGVLKD